MPRRFYLLRIKAVAVIADPQEYPWS